MITYNATMPSLLDDLNPAQQEAVKDTEGPTLILAGAGSGKTKVLTHRVAYLIQEKGIPPENILMVTFTNKAARSMLSRVECLSELYTGKIMGGTFHHIGNMILRRYAKVLGYNSKFNILIN